MVGEEARPVVVSEDSYLASEVFLDAPGAVGFVLGEVVEEVLLEDGVVLLQSFLLLLGLHVPEVRVVLEAKGFISGQTFESLVPPHFVG